MKRPSLVYQAKDILSALFNKGFGRSKHNDKKCENKSLIYSRNTYNSTLEKCCTFLGYCKEYFKVRFLKEIKPEYFREFIKSGNDRKGYNKETAEAYRSAVNKLQEGFNSRNNEKCIWTDASFKNEVIKSPSRSRQQMTGKIHDQIISKAYESKNETGMAFDMARNLGLRVSEITNLRIRDFSFDKKGNLQSVYINISKGGRSRKIGANFLTGEQRKTVAKVYEHFKEMKSKNDRLFVYKSGSYQRAFERIRDSISEDYKQCGIHSLRKEFAKDFYNREIEKGKTPIEVKRELTQLLGHNRLDVLRYYLK